MSPEAVSIGNPGMEMGAPGRPGLASRTSSNHNGLRGVGCKHRGRRGHYRDRLNRRRDLLELNYDALLLRAAYSDIANCIDQRW